MARKRKKNESGMVYSTNPSFSLDEETHDEQETLPPGNQVLYLSHDRKMRKGKVVTLVEGFVGTDVDLNQLGKLLKDKCGVGGSVKDGVIILQGEHRDKIIPVLEDKGYNTKRKGG